MPPIPACLVLGLPHLVSRPDEDSVLASLDSRWSSLASRSKIFRLSPVPGDPLTPEAAWFGLDPSAWQIPQGPLTVAALGRTPPDRSVSFHLSLLSVNAEGALAPAEDITPEEADEASLKLMALQTKRISILAGAGESHGLVWEGGPRELECQGLPEALGRPWEESLPSGEQQEALQGLIFDSREILEKTEANRRRQGEGLSPLSVAWPWGPGEAFQAPSLPLRRGAVLRVHSRSMRMLGLARLFGEWHCPPSRMGSEQRVDLAWLAASLESPEPVLAMIHPTPGLQAGEKLEILEALLAEIFTQIIDPFVRRDRPFRLTLLCPSDPYDGHKRALRVNPLGLGLNLDSRRPVTNVIPFDERALDEPKAPMYPLFEAAQRAVFDPYR